MIEPIEISQRMASSSSTSSQSRTVSNDDLSLLAMWPKQKGRATEETARVMSCSSDRAVNSAS